MCYLSIFKAILQRPISSLETEGRWDLWVLFEGLRPLQVTKHKAALRVCTCALTRKVSRVDRGVNQLFELMPLC